MFSTSSRIRRAEANRDNSKAKAAAGDHYYATLFILGSRYRLLKLELYAFFGASTATTLTMSFHVLEGEKPGALLAFKTIVE
jgi:hypothetical protein